MQRGNVYLLQGDMDYAPLIISLNKTREPLYIVNRPIPGIKKPQPMPQQHGLWLLG